MCGEGCPHGGCRRMLEKLRKGIQIKLIAASLLMSVLMSDYIFCNTLDELIELGCVFLLLAFSAVIVRDFSLFAYLNIICTNCLTVLLYMLSWHVFKNLFFKDMLIFLFFCSLLFFIATLFLRKKSDCITNCSIFIDVLLIVMGIVIYCFFSSEAKIRFSKNYHLTYIVLMQCFLVYPTIFIAAKSFRKIRTLKR